MSGHSKWSTIKRKKGAADQKRGKVFTRCIHEIAVAVREGNGIGDPEMNARLRFAVDRAKAANVPNDTIDRAIKRATGELKDGTIAEEYTYEGYGPGGTAVLVHVLTDNRHRTVGEVRHAFTRCGGNLGENGCVGWMFKKKGVVMVRRDGLSEERVTELALDVGADDVSEGGESWEILCEPSALESVRATMAKHATVESAEVQMIPGNRIAVAGKEAEQVMRLLEMLDDIDDVLDVSANCDLAAEGQS